MFPEVELFPRKSLVYICIYIYILQKKWCSPERKKKKKSWKTGNPFRQKTENERDNRPVLTGRGVLTRESPRSSPPAAPGPTVQGGREGKREREGGVEREREGEGEGAQDTHKNRFCSSKVPLLLSSFHLLSGSAILSVPQPPPPFLFSLPQTLSLTHSHARARTHTHAHARLWISSSREGVYPQTPL